MGYIFCVVIFILNVIFSKCFHNIFCLPRLMLLYWTINILCSIVIVKGYEWHYNGLFFIILLCILFGVGYKFVDYINKEKDKKYNKNLNIVSENIEKVLKLYILLGVLYSIINIYYLNANYLNLSIDEFFHFKTLVLINSKNAFLRYHGYEYKNILYQIFLIFVYLAPIIAGYIFNVNKIFKYSFLSLAAILPAFLVLLLQNTKAVLIIALILWIAGFLVGYYYKNHNYPEINKKQIFYIILVIIIFEIILFLSMMMRIGSFDLQTYNIVLNKFASYAVGHIVAFDYWFNNINIQNLNYGTMTFLGISNFVGIKERVPGIFLEFVNTGNIKTNVYTAFRALIMDFGIIYSSVLFLFVLCCF